MEGELYIARRSRPVSTPAPLPPELQQAIENPLARIRADAVQELAAVLRGRHAGRALAARLALEQLTGDDSRAVAAAATAALGGQAPSAPPKPTPPKLALPITVLDFGRLRLCSRSPERRVRIGNAGGGHLNARAATQASWLTLRQDGDELVVAADTSAAGKHEGTITIDSDGGTATIRVRARVRRAISRRWVIIATTAVGIAVIGLTITIIIVSSASKATPRVRWACPTGGFVSSPAVAGGTVYVGSNDTRVYALNAANGQLRWAYPTGGLVYSSPAVAGGTVYVGSNDNKVYALNAPGS